jgi:hypothetical protein
MPIGDNIFSEFVAGIAQLVERNLAKVEVASSSLVSRSTSPLKLSELIWYPGCDFRKNTNDYDCQDHNECKRERTS